MNEQIASLYADIGLKMTGALRGLREFRTRLQDSQSRLKTLRDQSKITNTALNLGLTAGLTALGTKAVSSFADAETAMNVFRVATHASAEEMNAASSAVEALARDLSLPGITRADAANALLALGNAGLSAKDSIAALRPALLLAEAGELKGAEAAEILANALQAFHLPGTEAARITDLLAGAALRASGTVKDHADALRQAGAVFAMVHVPIEDLVTSIALLSNAGIKGSDAGTSLRTMMLALINPTDEAKGLMTAMGVSVYDASGKMRDWRTIIGQFQKGLEPLTEAQKNQRLATIFGADAVRAASVIFGEGTKGFDAMKAAVTESGTAQQLATAKTEGLKGATDGLAKSIDTAASSAVKPFEQNIKDLAAALTTAVLWFDSLDDGQKKLVVSGAGLILSLGTLGVVVGAVSTLVVNAVTAVSTLWAWFGALGTAGEALGLGLAGPIAVFAGLAAGVIYAWENVDKLNDAFRRVTGVRIDLGAIFLNVPIIREIVGIWEQLKSWGVVGGGGHTSLPGGGGGSVGGSWNGTGTPPRTVTIGGGGSVPAMAAGGGARAGSPYWVGENGPELFVPGRSGAVVPNGGGGTVAVNFYGQVFGFADVKDMIVRAIDEAKREGRVRA